MIYINGSVVLTAPAAVFPKEKPETLHRMSALGHKRTYAVQKGMSALPPKADLIASPVLQRRPTRRLITKMVGEPKNPSESIDAPESRAAILSRPTLKRPDRPDRPDRDELIRPKGQARPIEQRYLLRVD